jgi:hypothetical protein
LRGEGGRVRWSCCDSERESERERERERKKRESEESERERERERKKRESEESEREREMKRERERDKRETPMDTHATNNKTNKLGILCRPPSFAPSRQLSTPAGPYYLPPAGVWPLTCPETRV